MNNFYKNNNNYGYLPFDLKKDHEIPNNSILILDNGDFFLGYNFGAPVTGVGELCFNTSITGYQEIITDPSYSKQIINFTFPHIGNVGINFDDYESNTSFAAGIITRQKPTKSSNWRSINQFDEWLKDLNIPGISGIDTRLITKKIRQSDSTNALIFSYKKNEPNFKKLFALLKEHPSMKGLELASEISTKTNYSWDEGVHMLLKNTKNKKNKKYNLVNVVALDFGIKKNILRNLFDRNVNVVVLPQNSSFEEIMSHKPSGVFLSNGPGDPGATKKETFHLLEKLIKQQLPIFGICIGHQLLAITLGAKTVKMKQGHRGANHPVKNLNSKEVEITSQNHGFVVSKDDLPEDLKITHISLFDKSIEGLEHKSLPIFSVQFHPESSPGPTDSSYLFDKFFDQIIRFHNAKKN